ncbi:hypothetical protein NG767_04360 [Aliarcobacter cryaerophilus]|uniref:hypothetical protein n=1 Tax=Aliarcobacter cryaerophilus TaxID=28198 RepID=UPI003DA2A066
MENIIDFIISNSYFVVFLLPLISLGIGYKYLKRNKVSKEEEKKDYCLNKNYIEATISLLIGLFVSFAIPLLNIKNKLQINENINKELIITNAMWYLVFLIVISFLLVFLIEKKSQLDNNSK